MLVLGIVGVQLVVWIPVMRALKRRRLAQLASVTAILTESAARGEPTRAGPIDCRIRRGHTRTRATVAVTDRRILVAGGQLHQVPLDAVRSVRTDFWFNGAATAGFVWVIVKLDDREFGIGVQKGTESLWSQAIERRPA